MNLRWLWFLSQTCLVFESDLPCFDSVLLVFFWVGPPLLWLSFSLLLSQSFPFLSQSFRVFCQSFSFFESVLPDFKSPTFPVNASYFWLWPIIFQWCQSVLPMLWVSPSHFFSLRTFCFSPFCVLIWSPCVLLTKLKMKVCAGSVYSTSMHKKLI